MDVLPNDPDESDHSELVIEVRLAEELPKQPVSRARRRRRVNGPLPNESKADALWIEAVKSKPPPEEKIRQVYGPAYCADNPTHVYVDGSCIGNGRSGAQAGAGVFFGHGNRRNVAMRVPGPQTNQRGELLAVWRALAGCNIHKPLIVYSDSQYVLQMLVEYAYRHAMVGWQGKNRDLVRPIVELLQRRPATVDFRKVKAHSGNEWNDAADELAKAGA
ncbi:ribonuclease H-like domain-containing protein, partial [Coprinopsis sp. MPI-PUGE-AT-0042]